MNVCWTLDLIGWQFLKWHTLITFRSTLALVRLPLLLGLLLLLAVQGGDLEGLLLANLLRLEVAELEVLRLLLDDRLLLANLLCLLLTLDELDAVVRLGLSRPSPLVVRELADLDLLALSVLVASHDLVSPRLRLANLLRLNVADFLGLLDKGGFARRSVVDVVPIEPVPGVSLGLSGGGRAGQGDQHGGENESLHVVVSGASRRELPTASH